MTRITVAYHNPYPSSIYATRSIFLGFKNAFTDMGHAFVVFSPGQDLQTFLDEHKPQLFITASHVVYRKWLNYELLRTWRRRNRLVLLTKIDFWDSPINRSRINEAPSMSRDNTVQRLIKAGLLGDYYFHPTKQDDPRMAGFSHFAGKAYITIPLAADTVVLKPHVETEYVSDISFIGTNLPQKRQFFQDWLFPLREKYDVRIYGQDWTLAARLLGTITKAGQYFNVPYVKNLQRPALKPEDEAAIYASSRLLVNIHEDYQRQYGGDCNERTFKIPFCSGLEICDDVAVVRDYFVDGKEIVVAKSRDEWFDKIDYYLCHPEEAKQIAAAGRQRALADHTYHHRARQILGLL